MLLAIDIGNTNIVLGIFKKNSLIATYRIETKNLSYAKGIKAFLKLHNIAPRQILNIIISSVAPSATKRIKKNIRQIFKLKPIVLGEYGNIVPIKNLYKYPKEVGQDRLVNSFATKTLYGYPSITIDFGTAITFDIVSKKGEYIGGLIFPGLEISLEALSKKAALLPKIKLEGPLGLIGKTTVESMRSGVYYGTGALCDGIIERLNKYFGFKFKVIATGGHSKNILKFCKLIDKVDIDLTLKGLNMIFSKIC